MVSGPIASHLTFTGGHEDDERLSGLVGAGCVFEVERVEIDDVMVRSFANAPRTLIDLFEIAATHEDKTYLVFENGRMTYGEVRRQAAGL
ncbi:hypothetical protein G3I15_41580, partial [Streptomyces sp. SID10244]|nr:hypothetical protein [Streptomyces sp. SID10244]